MEFHNNLHPAAWDWKQKLVREWCRFCQTLYRYRMILLVSSVVLALLVLAWIVWIALEPRSNLSSPANLSANALLDPLGNEEPKDALQNDFPRHVRNRLEESQIPLGTVSGATLPDGGRTLQRVPDPLNGSTF